MTARVGFLFPLGGGEWEIYHFAEAIDWRLRPYLIGTRLFGEDCNHDPVELARTAALDNLATAARSLLPLAPDAAMWACTSGSFILGRRHALAQAAAIADLLGRPASSTSLAFVHALEALGATRVAVLATYPQAAADAFARFLGESGVEVSALHSLGATGGQDAFALPLDAVESAANGLVDDGVQALLVPDTAMAGFELVRRLEARHGIPVLAANQVTVWEALRLANRMETVAGFGRLFERVAHGAGDAWPTTLRGSAR